MSATLLPFPGNPGAPVVPLPRDHFGLVRPEDRSQQERIRDAAREARNVFDQKHVCPSLKADLAARIRGVAQQLETLSEEAKSYGLLTTRVALQQHAGLLEGEAALVEAG